MGGAWPFIRRKLDVDSRNSDVFQPFRSLLILKQTLLRRWMFRKLGSMKSDGIVKRQYETGPIDNSYI